MRVPAAVNPLSPLPSVLLALAALLGLLLVPDAQGHDAAVPPSRSARSTRSARPALSPERHGLRPGGPLSGLPPALLERPDRLYDPTPGDLNATLLRAKLGRHFDPRIMSVLRPARTQRHPHKHRYNLLDADEALLDDDQVELDEDSPFRRTPRGRLVPVGEMPASIAALDFRGVRLPDGSRLRTRISARLRRKLQHFLWAYTACPVTRRWRDLGLRFWPRWLKEGHCPESPCSIPAGMRCKPAATRHQALLRWHCRAPALSLSVGPEAPAGTTRHCSWIKVEYPIITECSCGCAEDRHS